MVMFNYEYGGAMSNIRDEVFLGNNEHYTGILKQIADLAQPEKWTYGKYKVSSPYKILQNYFEHTYDRIKEENKFVCSTNGKYRCMNTGLLTIYNQEIFVVFVKNEKDTGLPWCLNRVCRDTDPFYINNIPKRPEIADYFSDVNDLIYDKKLEIKLNINHIIDDNYERFVEIGLNDKTVINALLTASKSTLEKRLLRNFKLALPFYYHNTSTGDHKIQLLVPLYLAGSPVKLALVLDKQTSASGVSYYEAITVLFVEWAYMNSRLIVKPDDEWARLIDEADAHTECETIEASIA